MPLCCRCITLVVMPERRITTFRLEDDLWTALQTVKERDGVPIGEQIRRGIKLWLDTKGVRVAGKTGRKRAATRRRP